MKLLSSFLFLFLSVVVLGSCTHKEKQIPRDIASLQASGGMEGIWFLQGTSSTRGPYNGELELRKSNDGTFNVVRVVTYINYFFDGLRVQEVWTGKAVASANTLTISYDIKQADFITKLGTLKRDPSEFRAPVTVLSRFVTSPAGLSTKFSDKKESEYSEWITTRRNLEARPLWVNERKNLDAKGKSIPVAVRGVIKLFKMDIGYDKDPLVKSYKNRLEFKDEHPYVVFDPTDFEFYRNNKDIIRVTNKITDDISITEAVVKRNAYSPTLPDKAQGYDKNAKDFHINEAGMVSHAVLDEQGRFVSYSPDGDSALWTGMYVASQAMRYLNTKESEALQNVRKSLKGLMTLMEITGDNKEFARTLAIYNPQNPVPQKWHRGTGKFANLIWLEGGNNDMVKGITHGFLWASLVIPTSDTEIWNELREKSRRLPDLRIMSEKPQNMPAALGLATLFTGDASYKERYLKSFNKLKVKVGLNFDTTFYWHGSADWSGINLSMVGDVTDIMVADMLKETELRDKMRERLMDAWVTYQPARRHLLTIAAYGFAYRHGTRGGDFRKESSEVRFSEALRESIWGLREIPYPRPNLDVNIDHSLRPEWCMSPIPRLFWKSLKKPEPPVSYFYQGLYSYPVFELSAFSSGFLWKDSAFAYTESHNRGVEQAGVDYLYAYWLARYSGVRDVQ
ncbi:hypothetical protein AZI85_12230 [Bdellovibrio bacteriovorus]|uniref:Lipoprotein n=1 Tax=Bdellovibrio bacteriovorus TaxID=959 RepID=A0A150WCY4_BDEBC|nr:hypothetical protein [Bdellovibrio bacteriovorus]KYG60751.1 hypothetical protein AZI85_12230 [Bdellovibrio bacteriovorus]